MKRAIAAFTGLILASTGLGSGRALAETILSVTQQSYDANLRPECTAVRMNSSVFGSPPASACTLGAEGTNTGPDRITKYVYDAAGQKLQVREGVGTSIERAEATYSYTLNGKQEYVIDANGNRSKWEYDGFDRLAKWFFPSTSRPTAYDPTTPVTASSSAGSINTGDYEAYGYDANDNRTTWRRRENQSTTVRSIATDYDALNRPISKAVDASVDITVGTSYAYAYDVSSNMTSASEGGRTVASVYDALGRLISETGPIGAVTYEYDAASHRTKIAWPDGFYVTSEYDNAGALKYLRRAGSDTLITLSYDDWGRRTTLSRGNGTSTAYTYDPTNLRLSSVAHTLVPTTSVDNVAFGLSYNVAGQITSRTISNSAYAWNGAYVVNRDYTTNGLNQFTAVGATSQTYDGRGNLKSDGTKTYQYDLENHLRGVVSGTSLIYDPLGRLYQSSGSTVTRYLYDGPNLIGEYSDSNALVRRYVHGPSVDEPLVRYTGQGTTPEYMLADHQGSIVAMTSSTGAIATVTVNNSTVRLLYTYDEYGAPGPSNVGLFQYTGQAYLADISLYHYKARAYSPTLGRFLQTDPTGYDDGLNWYAYVGNDPFNKTDASGLGPLVPALAGAGCAITIEVGCGPGAAVGAGIAVTVETAGVLCAAFCGKVWDHFHKNEAVTPSGAPAPEIKPEDLTGKTAGEVKDLAKEKGLVSDPKNPNKFRDPNTNKERLRIDKGHVDPKTGKPYDNPNAAGDHAHGYEPDGKTPIRDPQTGDKHFPLRPPN